MVPEGPVPIRYHFEALALYRYGTVPWRSVRFMLDSTDALMQAVEARFHMASAHAVGRAFRASKIWWCVDEPAPKVSRKAYLKHIFAARESFYAALNNFNCDIFCQGSPPQAQTPQRAATKSDLREAVKTILRGEDVPDAKSGASMTWTPRIVRIRERMASAAMGSAIVKSFIGLFLSTGHIIPFPRLY